MTPLLHLKQMAISATLRPSVHALKPWLGMKHRICSPSGNWARSANNASASAPLNVATVSPGIGGQVSGLGLPVIRNTSMRVTSVVSARTGTAAVWSPTTAWCELISAQSVERRSLSELGSDKVQGTHCGFVGAVQIVSCPPDQDSPKEKA